jgi:hypothetical protein
MPRDQCRLIVEKFKSRAIDVACDEYPGKARGFPRADTIVVVLEAEPAFLQRVFGLARKGELARHCRLPTAWSERPAGTLPS